MKNVGRKIDRWNITGVSPTNEFVNLTSKSEMFENKWKVFVFYPKDFTFVCPTEIVAYDKLVQDFEDRDAVLMVGSTDNEFSKVAWKNSHPDLKNLKTWMFADQMRYGRGGLIEELEAFDEDGGVAPRLTVILDTENVIQHITFNNLNVGRNADETLRVLDALQTGEKCACSRPVGGATI